MWLIVAVQSVQDAIPAASTTLFLALLELYKNGGIYVDLTTFFVRPLPPDLEGFVAGGDGPSGMTGEGVGKDCSLPGPSGRDQRALVMQVEKLIFFLYIFTIVFVFVHFNSCSVIFFCFIFRFLLFLFYF